MSRGLGKTQRLVLEVLAESGELSPEFRWVSVFEVAHRARCAGTLEQDGSLWEWSWKCDKCEAARPTPSDSESVRRAMRKLGDAGLVEVAHFVANIGRKHEWVNRRAYAGVPAARKQIFVRLPLTTDEAEAERERERQANARLAALMGKYA